MKRRWLSSRQRPCRRRGQRASAHTGVSHIPLPVEHTPKSSPFLTLRGDGKFLRCLTPCAAPTCLVSGWLCLLLPLFFTGRSGRRSPPCEEVFECERAQKFETFDRSINNRKSEEIKTITITKKCEQYTLGARMLQHSHSMCIFLTEYRR